MVMLGLGPVQFIGYPFQPVSYFLIMGAKSGFSYGIWPGRGFRMKTRFYRALSLMIISHGKIAHNKSDAILEIGDRHLTFMNGNFFILPKSKDKFDGHELHCIDDIVIPAWACSSPGLIKGLGIENNSFVLGPELNISDGYKMSPTGFSSFFS